MKPCIAFLIGAMCFIVPSRVEARMKEAQFTFTNEYSKPVEVELLNLNGRILGKRVLAPGKEIEVGSVRRVRIHIGGFDREYALPTVLRVRAASQGVGIKYVGMLGGKWRLRINERDALEIDYINGADVGQPVDLTGSPLGFPRRPRSANETFEQYKATLDDNEKIALKQSQERPGGASD